jgi:hypothetical protein
MPYWLFIDVEAQRAIGYLCLCPAYNLLFMFMPYGQIFLMGFSFLLILKPYGLLMCVNGLFYLLMLKPYGLFGVE